MNFEEALRYELSEIPEASNKVFPLFAPKETGAPFLVYKKAGLSFRKTLGGTLNKAQGNYVLSIVTSSYAELQSLTTNTINKLLSFQSRAIGLDGPIISNITAEITGDSFEPEVELFVTEIIVKVEY